MIKTPPLFLVPMDLRGKWCLGEMAFGGIGSKSEGSASLLESPDPFLKDPFSSGLAGFSKDDKDREAANHLKAELCKVFNEQQKVRSVALYYFE